MKVWIITVGEPLPTDGSGDRLLRSGMLAQRLARHGHEVTWWASTFDHNGKRLRFDAPTTIEASPHLTLKLLHAKPYRTNVSARRVLHHLALAKEFGAELDRVERPDFIWCSLPLTELCDRATAYAKRHSIPIVLDVRDLWPDAIGGVLPPLWRAAASPWLGYMSAQANRALARASAVVGVSDAYLRWGLERGRRRQGAFDRVLPLGYAKARVSADEIEQAKAGLAAKGVDFDRRIFWFVGLCGRTYDLATVIDAIRLVPRELRAGIQFVFSGEGELREQWQRKAEGLDEVVFTGWVNGAEIACIGQHAYCGLQAYAAGAPQGLANKLFEYMSFGLPILSSLSGENQAILDEHSIGITYKAADARSCAGAIERVLRDSKWTADARRKALAVYSEHFDADTIYADAVAYIERLAEHVREGGRARTPASSAQRLSATAAAGDTLKS
jgi:glycosyltransferase involved in cell wall biosynthesis